MAEGSKINRLAVKEMEKKLKELESANQAGSQYYKQMKIKYTLAGGKNIE